MLTSTSIQRGRYQPALPGAILVAPWSGSMANLWYTPVSTNKIWPYTNSIPSLSNFWPYPTATAGPTRLNMHGTTSLSYTSSSAK